MDIRTVTVLGANGTMGRNVAGMFASFGDARVFMICRDLAAAEAARPLAALSVRAESVEANLIPADYSTLEECVSQSDLVFESVAETYEAKGGVTERVGTCLKSGAVMCTGSSGLSVDRLAKALPEEKRGRYMGVHMFNPPYSMTLCEVIPTGWTDRVLIDRMKKYLSNRLLRTVVEVRDTPAFLANRVGFQFINKAMQAAETFADDGGIDYVDALLGPFTGRAMAPLVTADFVGLDVHQSIVDNVFANTNDFMHDSFRLPSYARNLVASGALGKKSGAGLYRHVCGEGKADKMEVYDIATGLYRDKVAYRFPFVESMVSSLRVGDYAAAFKTLLTNRSVEADFCLSMLLKYIVYSLVVSSELGGGGAAADDAMATGFNWCPPTALAGAISEVDDLESLVRERLVDLLDSSIDCAGLLASIVPSEYDYRRFFRALR